MKDRVIMIHDWFATSYHFITGRHVAFPSNTDPTKTYQYRSVKKFADKVLELGISDVAIRFLIDEIIKYSKEQNLLSRGVAVLNKSDLLEECYRRIQKYMEQSDQLVADVRASHTFFHKNHGFAHIARRGGYSNLVLWYQSGRLCEEFVALSKSCLRLVGLLPPNERSKIPDLTDLLLVRRRCLNSEIVRDKLREVLGEDLYEDQKIVHFGRQGPL
jgi:hypothetical protein